MLKTGLKKMLSVLLLLSLVSFSMSAQEKVYTVTQGQLTELKQIIETQEQKLTEQAGSIQRLNQELTEQSESFRKLNQQELLKEIRIAGVSFAIGATVGAVITIALTR